MGAGGSLAGRVAVVTGGARGIGAAVVETLAGERATVVIADVDRRVARDLADDLRAKGLDVDPIDADVADEAAVAALVASTIERHGRIDILDNNAALTDAAVLAHDLAVDMLDAAVWDRMFAVNLRSQYLMAKHVVPHMVEHGRGAIVNMSSGAARSGDMIRTAYSASKAGVESLTRSLATQYGRAGVRANTVVPGLIITQAVRDGVPPDMLAKYTASALTPYAGEPRDVAHLVRFLVSDEARYITGQTIVIDGGMSAHSG